MRPFGNTSRIISFFNSKIDEGNEFAVQNAIASVSFGSFIDIYVKGAIDLHVIPICSGLNGNMDCFVYEGVTITGATGTVLTAFNRHTI